MHEEKIWAMDFKETTEVVEATEKDDGLRYELKMVTGAGDSTVKLWSDNTVEE